MKITRRNLALLLPALAAAQDKDKRLPSKTFKFEELPTKVNATNQSKSHAVLDGQTHSGFPIEVHITEMPAGQSPHPPHQHVHEEMFMLQAGVIEVTISGKT